MNRLFVVACERIIAGELRLYFEKRLLKQDKANCDMF